MNLNQSNYAKIMSIKLLIQNNYYIEFNSRLFDLINLITLLLILLSMISFLFTENYG